MTKSKGDAFLVTAAPGLRRAAIEWIDHLGRERRLAAKTLEAYGRDLEQLFKHPLTDLGLEKVTQDAKKIPKG